MKFRVVISGTAMGFVPVRVTPIDVPVLRIWADVLASFAATVKPTPIRFFGFSGTVSLEIKTGA